MVENDHAIWARSRRVGVLQRPAVLTANREKEMTSRPFLTLSTKTLNRCEPGELIRFFSRDWALVVNGGSAIALTGPHAPELRNLGDTPCLSYGKEFELLPEYGEACEVLDAKKTTIPAGTLIYAQGPSGETTERYLLATSEPYLLSAEPPFPSRHRWRVDLEKFVIGQGEVEGICAAFKRWSIWAMVPSCPSRPTKIFEFGGQTKA